MFHREKIKSIQPDDYVLEVGPGSVPHPRANVLLDRRFVSEQVAHAQRGYASEVSYQQPIIYYDGGKFPFCDNEFNYVICSHVLEHIPIEELGLFISELQRVAPKGYIEFPNIFYELINYQDVHKWFMNYRDDIVLFLDKEIFSSNTIHKIYRESFYGNDKYLSRAFKRYKEFFITGFEWFNKINYQIVKSYDELVNESDYKFWKEYFSKYQPPIEPPFQKPNFKDRLIKNIIWQLRAIKRAFTVSVNEKKPYIHKTSTIEKRDLVLIEETAEIKEYVIIKTKHNQVVIGKHTQINPFTVIYGGSGVFIGDNVMIAPHCMIAAGEHDFRQLDKPMRFAGNITKGPIVIEDNVWIGANVTITDGVKIGRDAVVAANSVVIEDVAPFDIVGGVPSKVIGNRKDIVLGSITK